MQAAERSEPGPEVQGPGESGRGEDGVMKGCGERPGACLQLAGAFLRWVRALQVSRAMWCQPQTWRLSVGCAKPCVLLFQGLRKILLEEQRRSFLQRALHAVHNGPMHISQAGLVLLYAILGEAGRLMEHKVSSHVGGAGREESELRAPRLCST